MSINIACSVPDCPNPVIGQCTGYKKACGKYYCRVHSSDTLCFDCSSQKAAEDHAELVYKEYLALAIKVSNEPMSIPEFQFQGKSIFKIGGWSIAIGTFLFLSLRIFSTTVGNLNSEISQGFIGFYILSIIGAYTLIGLPFIVIPLIWFYQNQDWNTKERRKVVSSRIIDFEREKQGFTQFYNAWVKQRREEQAEKNKQALMGVLTVIGVIAAGAIAAGMSESEYDRTRRAVRDEMNSN